MPAPCCQFTKVFFLFTKLYFFFSKNVSVEASSGFAAHLFGPQGGSEPAGGQGATSVQGARGDQEAGRQALRRSLVTATDVTG